MLAAGTLDGDIREAAPREGDEMHALVRCIDREICAELAFERGDQFVALRFVQHAHAVNMRGEMAFFHEGGDYGLA